MLLPNRLGTLNFLSNSNKGHFARSKIILYIRFSGRALNPSQSLV